MKNYTSWIIVVVAVVLIIAGMVWYSSRPGAHDAFASCIQESGAKFFGAFWCPHCQTQKAMFGKSAKLLPYVECSTPNGKAQLEICKDNKVETYPTWHFKDGTVKTGTLSFTELSVLTSCPISKLN